MIDLHCHILPGIDDGASDLTVSLEMAKASVADGVSVLACTPHILPGLYDNSGPLIRQATERLQQVLDEQGVPLRLVTGADNHVVPDMVGGLRAGRLLSLADTRYVLVEPPHHVAPVRLEDAFFALLVAGYVPILTHPERLSWIEAQYSLIQRLAQRGVWMQITAGSLTGAFGRRAQYWANRMLDEGCAHILATDAHDSRRRPPNLSAGLDLAAKRIGAGEAQHLVTTRPLAILNNSSATSVPEPAVLSSEVLAHAQAEDAQMRPGSAGGPARGLTDRLRRLFKR